MKFHKILTAIFYISIILNSCSTKTKYLLEQNNTPEKFELTNTIVESDNFTYENKIYLSNIKTILCYKKGDELSPPIIQLNSNEKIILKFDDLSADRKNYKYSIFHCNSNWEKSNLVHNEYNSGFKYDDVINYNYSFNTNQKYIHYEIEFPNSSIQPLISGNYVLRLFDELDSTVFFRRFMILENSTFIKSNIKKATLMSNRDTKHEIDFTVYHPNIVISNPFSEIKVIVKQNNFEATKIDNLKPRFIKEGQLIYDYEDINNFNGNNEFRYFDIKSLRFLSDRIDKINYLNLNHVYLFEDKKRSFDLYSILPDLNGNFIIKKQEGWDSSLEADYTFVYFTLNCEKINLGDIYLIGGFSDWKINEDFKLDYNNKEEKYEANLLLKQGYYNYLYALKQYENQKVDISFIEGSHYETRNNYYIYVYFKEIGEKYERLIGYHIDSSNELF